MIEKDYISISDLTPGDSIKRLVRQQWPNIHCIFPDNVSNFGDSPKPTLVVTGGDPELILSLPNSNQPFNSAPILYLGAGDSIPVCLQKYANDRLIDYLALPVSKEIFFHRISFLLKVQKISEEQHAQRVTLNQQLDLFSTRDGLTGLFNRRHLTNRLMEIFQHALATADELSLLLLNIDYFSSINKSLGLEFGDAILNELAARLTETTGAAASCYRFSGEDFVVLLPGANLQQACDTAAKIRKVCAEKPFTNGQSTITLTISVGITSLKDHQPGNHNDFIHMAETALFMAKAEGRNRFQVYLPHNVPREFSSQQALTLLKENLNRILQKTKTSAIASLQLLAQNMAGSGHQGHIENVSHYVALLGKQLGLSDRHTQTFQNSITLYNSFRHLLHNSLLSKSEKLTPRERKTLEDLPFKLNELTDMFDYFAEERNVLLGHRERYDGTGYPLGLEGDEIPLGARIFNIVDSLAAMNSERPYRRKLSPTEIIEELKKEAGKQFDPFLVYQILEVIKKNKLLNLDPNYLDQAQQDLHNNLTTLRS